MNYHHIPIIIISTLSAVGMLCIIMDMIFNKDEDNSIVLETSRPLQASVIIDLDEDTNNTNTYNDYQDFASDLLSDDDSLFVNEPDSLS